MQGMYRQIQEPPFFLQAFLVAPRKISLEKPRLFLAMIPVLCNNLRARGM